MVSKIPSWQGANWSSLARFSPRNSWRCDQHQPPSDMYSKVISAFPFYFRGWSTIATYVVSPPVPGCHWDTNHHQLLTEPFRAAAHFVAGSSHFHLSTDAGSLSAFGRATESAGGGSPAGDRRWRGWNSNNETPKTRGAFWGFSVGL